MWVACYAYDLTNKQICLQVRSCGVQYTRTHNVVLYNGFSVYYFGFYVKSHGVYLSLYFLVFVMWLSTLLTIHFSFLLVCALCFLYLFVFKHVYFWLPYASAAVANSVTVFARYFCGDHFPSHAIKLWLATLTTRLMALGEASTEENTRTCMHMCKPVFPVVCLVLLSAVLLNQLSLPSYFHCPAPMSLFSVVRSLSHPIYNPDE